MSIVESTAFEKKQVPAPNIYKGCAKDMFEGMKGGGSTVQYGPRGEAEPNDRLTKIKKNNLPGPNTFKVAEAIEKST